MFIRMPVTVKDNAKLRLTFMKSQAFQVYWGELFAHRLAYTEARLSEFATEHMDMQAASHMHSSKPIRTLWTHNFCGLHVKQYDL